MLVRSAQRISENPHPSYIFCPIEDGPLASGAFARVLKPLSAVLGDGFSCFLGVGIGDEISPATCGSGGIEREDKESS